MPRLSAPPARRLLTAWLGGLLVLAAAATLASACVPRAVQLDSDDDGDLLSGRVVLAPANASWGASAFVPRFHGRNYRFANAGLGPATFAQCNFAALDPGPVPVAACCRLLACLRACALARPLARKDAPAYPLWPMVLSLKACTACCSRSRAGRRTARRRRR